MAFLAPLWLSLAALAAIPVLLHLLRRNIGSRVEFPAVRYLQSAERESSRDVRARNLWLLLLRILIVILLSLAAAKPVWTRGVGTPRALAIVLDNSLSTTAIVGGAPVLDRLTAAARALRAASQSAERIWLITADGTVFTGPAAIDAALSRVIPLHGAGQLNAAVQSAITLAGTDGGAVAIITDGQKTAWERDLSRTTARIRVFAPALAAPPNGAILSAVAQPQWFAPRGALALTVRPVRDSTAYRIAIGGSTVARGVIVRAPGDSLATQRIPLVGAGSGWETLDVTLEPSGVGGDDRAVVPIVVGAAPAVREGAGEFVAAAVASLRETGRVRASGDVTVTIAPAAAVGALPALILPPADAGGVPAANAALARLGVPWRFGAEQRGAQLARANDDALRGDSAVRVSQWFPLVAQPDAIGDTIAEVGDAVWMVRGPRWIVLGSALAPTSTTFPVRAAFVPWLADAISNLATGSTAAHTVAPGATVAVPRGATALRSTDSTVRSSLTTATIAAPATPGVYFWMRGAEVTGALGVQIEATEPQLARATSAELMAYFGTPDNVDVNADVAGFLGSVRQSGASQPIASPLLLLALLAVLAEAWLSGRFRTRGTADTSARIA